MRTGNRVFLLVVTMLTSMGCDQATKKLAALTLKSARPLTYFGNLLRIEYAENHGAFLGLGANWPADVRWALLTFAASLVLAGMALYVCLRRSLGRVEVVGYVLILGGGASNMLERATAGRVIDFLNLGVGAFRTGIFNLADMVIMAGLVLVLAAQTRQLLQSGTPGPQDGEAPPRPDCGQKDLEIIGLTPPDSPRRG